MAYAILSGGVAVNIVMASPEFAASQGWVEATGGAGIGWAWNGSAWSAPAGGDASLPTDKPLTSAQWHYGLDRFGLRTAVTSTVAAVAAGDTARAAALNARAFHASKYSFADVLGMLAEFSDDLPSALQLTEAEVAGMWATIQTEFPA